MAVLRHVLFESPLAIYILAGLGELIAIAVWQSRRGRVAKAMMIVLPVAAVAVGITAWLVDTPVEKTTRSYEAILTAIDERNVPGILAYMSDDFNSDGLRKDSLAGLAEKAFERLRNDHLDFSLFRIQEASSDSVTATLAVSWQTMGATTRWRVRFTPGADGVWRLTGAQCTEPRGLTIRNGLGRL